MEEIESTDPELALRLLILFLQDDDQEYDNSLNELHQLEQRISRENYPFCWSFLQFQLGHYLINEENANQQGAIEQGIQYYENALEVFTHEQTPRL